MRGGIHTSSGTWSALRYVKPGPDVLRRLPHDAEGIPRPDGSVPESVRKANDMLDNAIDVVDAACDHGAEAMSESPVSRDADSPHSIKRARRSRVNVELPGPRKIGGPTADERRRVRSVPHRAKMAEDHLSSRHAEACE